MQLQIFPSFSSVSKKTVIALMCLFLCVNSLAGTASAYKIDSTGDALVSFEVFYDCTAHVIANSYENKKGLAKQRYRHTQNMLLSLD